MTKFIICWQILIIALCFVDSTNNKEEINSD